MDNQFSPPYEIAGSDANLSSDGRWHPGLFLNPSYSQEEFLHGLLSSSCGMEEDDFSRSHYNEDEPAEETYEGEEQLPYYSSGHWLSDYEHSFDHCRGDGYFSPGDGIQQTEDGSELRKVEEDPGKCEQHYERSSGHEVTQEDYPALSTWSFDSWFVCGGKADSHGYNEQESRTSLSYHPSDIAVFESIFGYWPCLNRY